MRIDRILVLASTMLALAACSTWQTSSVQSPVGSAAAPAAAKPARPPEQITVTENDITDRPYRSLGDISVTVHKTTLFNADPTRESVNEALRAEGAKLGADAIVLVRYGTVGIGFMSWGQMEGQGRAVSFEN